MPGVNRPNSALVGDIVSDIIAGLREDGPSECEMHKLMSVAGYALIMTGHHLVHHLEYYAAGLLLWRCGLDIVENVLEGDAEIIKGFIKASLADEAKLQQGGDNDP